MKIDRDLDENVLICMPNESWVTAVPGSIVRKCFYCEREIWVSRTGQDALNSGKINYAICLQCARLDPAIRARGILNHELQRKMFEEAKSSLPDITRRKTDGQN